MKYYEKIFEKKAVKYLQSLQNNQQKRIMNAIKKLPVGDIKPLKNHDGLFRLRVGDYRVIFTKQDDISLITILNAGHRRDIYGNL